ncbi:MAG: hypothetical protein KGS61_08670, partial [Verrucomicrobia bacterium]|nr:hypothetical protein [Verrucomicrobiota bacterium]
MNHEPANPLRLAPADRKRSNRSLGLILLGVLLIAGTAAFFAWPRAADSRRMVGAPDGAAPSADPSAPGKAGAPVRG